MLRHFHLPQVDSATALSSAVADARARGLPTVVLLSTKPTIAPLFRAVSTALEGRAACVQVGPAVEDVSELLTLAKEEIARPAVVLVDVQGKGQVYDGELTAGALRGWLVPPRVLETALVAVRGVFCA